jgi:hypothetical protein
MQEEEFYATIKLVTGEEIVSKVCYMPDEDSLILENPLEVLPVEQTKSSVKINGFTLVEWIRSTLDQMFVLPKQHILTMTETDKKIEVFYKKTLKKLNSGVENSQFTRKMGRIGSVKETKKYLEDIYKL